MAKKPPKIRFFLQAQSRTIKRNLKSKDRNPGSRQLDVYISVGKVHMGHFYGKKWIRQGNYSGEVQLGWDGVGMSQTEKDRLQKSKKRIGKYKIAKSGELIDYRKIKMATGVFILPDSWNSKEQKAVGVYEPLNRLLNQWRHVITITHAELVQRADFNSKKLVAEIKKRMKEGVPITVSIPATASPMQVISQVAKSMDGKSIVDISNPHGVPDDMRKFIPYYNKNRLDTKKLSDETVKSREELSNKLQRYFEQTGKTLSITQSSLQDVSAFFKWRMYDNEENKARKGKNSIVNGTKNKSVGMGTMNKCKKLTRFFFARAVDNFECTLRFNTENVTFNEIPYDREMNDVYLNMDQLFEIQKLDLKGNERMERHRSLFIQGCLGGGYRVSDLVKLPRPTLERFEDGLEYYCFSVRSQKTNTKTLVPIPHELNPLIESYDYETETKPHDFRDDIKTLGELCGWNYTYKYEEILADGTPEPVEKPFKDMLMPRTCRKSFCSILYNFYDLSKEECCDYSGHDPNSDEFLKYLRIDKKVKAQRLVRKFNAKPIFF